MSAERLKIEKEKELLEREKTDFESKLQRSFNENKMQRMKHLYELKLREVKVRITNFIFAYYTSVAK